jgi:flagellin
VQGSSLGAPVDLTLSVTTSSTVDTAITSLSSLVANNSALIAAGITVTESMAGSPVRFTSKRGENFEVLAVNDTGNLLGLGTAQSTVATSGGGFDVTSITSGTVGSGSGAQVLGISVGGGSYLTVSHTFTSSTTAADLVNTLNSAFSSNTSLQQAGLVASSSGGTITLASNNGSFFRVSSNTSGAGWGFGTTAGTTSTTSVSGSSNTSTATLNSGGASATGLLAYSPIRSGNDDQTVTISAKDATGTPVSLALTLASDSGALRSRSIDEAIDYINEQIQASTNEDIKRIVAIKERDPAAGGAEKIRFLSPLAEFQVSVGDNPGNTGISSNQGEVVTTTVLAGGATVDISSQTNAAAAVSALAKAVTQLGKVQAVVGRGQNQFNFAISLAQTQISNLAASESRIRDADLAAEAANLAKAQILQQAGIAALGQANSAPQAVLSLLQG